MISITQIYINGKQWPSVVPFETEKPFQDAIFAGKKMGLDDTISYYLGEAVEPRRDETIPVESFKYSNILPVRKTDIMLVTPPKTGTTFMQQLCHQIKTRGGDDSMNFENIKHVSPWFDYVQREDDDIENLENPRVFKTHRLLSESRRGCKYIATIRNPEDTTKSYYAFLKDLDSPVLRECASVSEIVLNNQYPSRKMYGGTLWEHFNEFWRAQEMDNLLVIPYEFLTSDLAKVAPIVASFMGVPPLSPTELENVVMKCKKEFMGSKEHNGKFNSVVKKENATKVARKVNLDKKPELTEEAKTALAQKWEQEVFSITDKRSYIEFSEHFKQKLLNRASVDKDI